MRIVRLRVQFRQLFGPGILRPKKRHSAKRAEHRPHTRVGSLSTGKSSVNPRLHGARRGREGQKRASSLGYNVFVDLSLREFRREDFDLLWSIDQECFPPGIAYSRRELADYIRRRGSFTLVAVAVDVDGNRTSRAGPASLNGFVVAEAGRRGVGHIITIDVLPAARRSGAGSQLLKAAEDRLRAANCHTVILETAVDNKIALAFYKRHQYELIKTLPRYYSNGVDALVLQKDLLSPSNPAKLPT